MANRLAKLNHVGMWLLAPAGDSLLNKLILPVPWRILIGACGRGNGPAAPFKWLRRAVKEAAEVSSENIIRTFLEFSTCDAEETFARLHRWTSFCLLSGFEVAAISLAQLFAFLESLAVGTFFDRGRGRRASAVATLAALQFGAWKLGLSVLENLLASSPVKAWKRGTDWHKSLCREAVPLPVAVVKKLEEAASQGAEDSLFLCSMLLMCWCGLRWSDLQRISLDKVSPSDGILHGSCWRTKARKRGMVWGCMSDGFLQSAWG